MIFWSCHLLILNNFKFASEICFGKIFWLLRMRSDSEAKERLTIGGGGGRGRERESCNRHAKNQCVTTL